MFLIERRGSGQKAGGNANGIESGGLENAPVLPGAYREARRARDEDVWRQLSEITVWQGVQAWLHTLNPLTAKNYRAGLQRLVRLNLLDLGQTLQQFALINHEAVVDDIKRLEHWKEATRQARAAAYISFTGFLQRRTQGIIHKAVSSKEGANKTFFKVREKVKTPALSQLQSRQFLQQVELLNRRDALVAKLLLQGGKRKSEVLALKVDQIDFSRQTIAYRQTKTRGTEKVTIINYPSHVMDELRAYIGDRTGWVFVTRHQRRLSPFQIDRTFRRAGELAGIPFRVTPHVMRVTLVTRLKELKIQDSDIMKITGHANPAQLASYDKTDLADNPTLYHHFV
jgi:integrase/recombinase XerD